MSSVRFMQINTNDRKYNYEQRVRKEHEICVRFEKKNNVGKNSDGECEIKTKIPCTHMRFCFQSATLRHQIAREQHLRTDSQRKTHHHLKEKKG